MAWLELLLEFDHEFVAALRFNMKNVAHHKEDVETLKKKKKYVFLMADRLLSSYRPPPLLRYCSSSISSSRLGIVV